MRAALFVTCLAEYVRPSIADASLKLLRDAGIEADTPEPQICCGQPAYNHGHRASAKAIARQLIDTFREYDRVIVPSGSCAGMLIQHYPKLLADDKRIAAPARELAAKTVELTSFLASLESFEIDAELNAVAAYHDSCSSFRELGIHDAPRRLLAQVRGLKLASLADHEACCGFGGSFIVEFPELSARIADDKLDDVGHTGAEVLIGGDLGCLLNLGGRIGKRGLPVRVFHIAEVLAGMTEDLDSLSSVIPTDR